MWTSGGIAAGDSGADCQKSSILRLDAVDLALIVSPVLQHIWERAGWYMSYVHEPARDDSDLVIVDASDFTGKPVARVHLPQRVPHGFRSNWITD